MRIGLKVFGVAIALCGVFFLSIFPFTLGNAIKTSDNGAAIFSLLLAVLGFGFIFAGRLYFHSSPDGETGPRPATAFSHFLVEHRRELKLLAQVGFVLSSLSLIAVWFGSDWPTRWTIYVLLTGAFILQGCGKKAANPAVTDNRDWMTIPARTRHVFELAEKGLGALMVGFALLALLSLVNHSEGVSHFAALAALDSLDALATVIYARTALFFAYGELLPASEE